MSKKQRTHNNKIYVNAKAQSCPLCDIDPAICVAHRPAVRNEQQNARRAVQARAWDKGYYAAVADYEEDSVTAARNPYRKRKRK